MEDCADEILGLSSQGEDGIGAQLGVCRVGNGVRKDLPVEQVLDQIKIHRLLEARKIGDVLDQSFVWFQGEESPPDQVRGKLLPHLPSPDVDLLGILLLPHGGQSVPGRKSTFAVIRPLQQQAEFKFPITSGFPPSENYCDSYWDGFFGFLIIWLYMKGSGGNARFLFFILSSRVK